MVGRYWEITPKNSGVSMISNRANIRIGRQFTINVLSCYASNVQLPKTKLKTTSNKYDNNRELEENAIEFRSISWLISILTFIMYS